ncbi:MAG: hypothetical protein CL944_00350 [Candidatus Diapherotrites archaeon]|uniref:Uncharacterized protein n=1 Tax=Candidatus Iainarchaeum sp. TaxID=3101447 RepID=A0A2D6LNZ2_9ARCH|nr:hypothetical protein [Candidatus Diapherotrites archaeon]|tara:strand:+ start:20075 stop:20728 length:654 start_codon:yes stop_codon:yes gene_type:complete
MALDIETASQQLVNPINSFWNSLVTYLPGIVGALLVIGIGYLVGLIVGDVLTKILQKLNADDWLKKIKRADALGGVTISSLAGKLVKWWIFIGFLASAANLIELEAVAAILTDVAIWAPHLIIGVIIMAAGLLIADYAAAEIAKAKKFKAVSAAVRIFILIYFAIYALKEVGLRVELAESTLLIIIAGIVFALSLGFGLGLKTHAEQIIGDMRKEIK